MKRYIGTKIIEAQPMNRADYNTYRDWVLPANENGDDEGYLVEYLDGGKPNDSRHAGYISWSPKDVFERTYVEFVACDDESQGDVEDEQWPSDVLDESTEAQTIEQEIQAKGQTAPRVTPADIEANIASENYFTAMEGVIGGEMAEGQSIGEVKDHKALMLLTFCVLVLRNGFTVTGESACASPKNFDAELGRKIARANAVSKLWPLMGYALKEQLWQGGVA